MFNLVMRRVSGGTMIQRGVSFEVATRNANLLFCLYAEDYIAAEIIPC